MKLKSIILVAAACAMLSSCGQFSLSGSTRFGEFSTNPDRSFTLHPSPAILRAK